MISVGALFGGDCRFVCGVPSPGELPPPHLPEIAFAGRSNAGKSSLINALVNKPGLARASVTPGRTQAFNCFLLAEKLVLVDMPGYGYAKAPKKMVDRWNHNIRYYLSQRPTIRRVCLVLDARRGLMESDREMMALLDAAAVRYSAVLTKADKLSPNQANKVAETVAEEIALHPAAYPEVFLTSSQKKIGLEALRSALANS